MLTLEPAPGPCFERVLHARGRKAIVSFQERPANSGMSILPRFARKAEVQPAEAAPTRVSRQSKTRVTE